MIERVEAERVVCDGCGSVQIVQSHDERPIGYYLSVGRVHDGGGDGADDVYACRQRCIARAVLNALDRENR